MSCTSRSHLTQHALPLLSPSITQRSLPRIDSNYICISAAEASLGVASLCWGFLPAAAAVAGEHLVVAASTERSSDNSSISSISTIYNSNARLLRQRCHPRCGQGTPLSSRSQKPLVRGHVPSDLSLCVYLLTLVDDRGDSTIRAGRVVSRQA